jgi:hypothetical protein
MTDKHLFLFTVTHHPRTGEYSAQCVSGAGVHGPWWCYTAAKALAAAREGTKSMIFRDIDAAPAVSRVAGGAYDDHGEAWVPTCGEANHDPQCPMCKADDMRA